VDDDYKIYGIWFLKSKIVAKILQKRKTSARPCLWSANGPKARKVWHSSKFSNLEKLVIAKPSSPNSTQSSRWPNDHKSHPTHPLTSSSQYHTIHSLKIRANNTKTSHAHKQLSKHIKKILWTHVWHPWKQFLDVTFNYKVF
jgi:hypothetical protein